jgi:retron-type reverse transcriptase
VQDLLKAGYVHIVDADLKSYFDTIPKDRLKALIGRKVTDGRIMALIASFLEQGVLDGTQEWTPEQGTPRGAVVSPLLSNIYLDPLDHLMAERGLRDGALRGRLRGDVPERRGRCRGSGGGAAMDGASRPDAASDQDAAGRRT